MKIVKKLFNIYKIPLLISLTLLIAIIALLVLKSPVDILVAFLGTFLGTFFLDLDYFIYAYFTDSDKGFSQTLKGFLKHGDILNAINHIYYHRGDIKEKTLQSVLFQVVMGGFSLFMIFSPINLFAKSFVISIYVNSLYRLAEKYAREDTADWFWVLKEKPSRKGVKVYLIVNVVLLLVALQFL